MVGNLEQDSGVESFALYAELTKSHKWLDKVIGLYVGGGSGLNMS